MKPARCAALGFSIAIGSVLSYAQSDPVPTAQIQHDRQPAADLIFPAADLSPASGSFSAASFSAASSLPAAPGSASSLTGFRRAPAATGPATLDARYFWLNGLHLSLAVADITMTQHCIDAHTCREGNPLMPSSEAGKYGLSLGLVAYTAATSYWFKKHRSKAWWAGPTVGIAAHTVGLASGWMHR